MSLSLKQVVGWEWMISEQCKTMQLVWVTDTTRSVTNNSNRQGHRGTLALRCITQQHWSKHNNILENTTFQKTQHYGQQKKQRQKRKHFRKHNNKTDIFSFAVAFSKMCFRFCCCVFRSICFLWCILSNLFVFSIILCLLCLINVVFCTSTQMLCVEEFIIAMESQSKQKLICVAARGGPAID